MKHMMEQSECEFLCKLQKWLNETLEILKTVYGEYSGQNLWM
jgi:hypothetical protein